MTSVQGRVEDHAPKDIQAGRAGSSWYSNWKFLAQKMSLLPDLVFNRLAVGLPKADKLLVNEIIETTVYLFIEPGDVDNPDNNKNKSDDF